MQVFQVKTVSDISCCKNKFKIKCSSAVMCEHFDHVISEHILWQLDIFEYILLNITKVGYCFSKIVPGEVSWSLGQRGKLFLARGKKN